MVRTNDLLDLTHLLQDKRLSEDEKLIASHNTAVTFHLPFSCKRGWEYFDKSCYQLSTTAGNYDSVIKQCNDAGGYLATINSENENTFIVNSFVKDNKKVTPVWF